MLPDSSLGKTSTLNAAKFADTGIEALIEKLKMEGAQHYRLKAKIAGGAQMFQFTTDNDTMRIGPRNVEAVKNELKKYGIPIVAENTGGNSGRTIEFNPETSLLNIRTVNAGVCDI
ncbi:putative chemoreceptor glutamine deamidase CheD OS=Ureibacillus acetophenoni OX=614649 GN=cheD PE=3 SV=1 [Ureibacillus acetophenoni]